MSFDHSNVLWDKEWEERGKWFGWGMRADHSVERDGRGKSWDSIMTGKMRRNSADQGSR